jgi:Fur family ferric uptake transcriptional regulator
LRCTPARLALLVELSRAANPLSHADLAVKLAPLAVDRATVYRNLTELADAGLLLRVDVGDHVWRFELRREDADPGEDHPHFYCVACGQVSCLAGVEVSIKPSPGTKRSAVGEVTEVLLKGRCSHCH